MRKSFVGADARHRPLLKFPVFADQLALSQGYLRGDVGIAPYGF